jgi:diguanylate cyclase (GGDEF)-like protein
MYQKSTFFRNRVARRIFLLFVISSLIPVLIMAVLSLRQVNTLTTEQITSRLKQDAKFYGLSVYDRLLVIEDELEFYAYILQSEKSEEIALTSDKGHISALQLQLDDEKQSLLFGVFHPLPNFSDSDRQHMQAGKSLISVVEGDENAPAIFMSRLISPGSEQRGIVSALIEPAYLWGDPDLFSNEISLCMFGLSSYYLHCSQNPRNPFFGMGKARFNPASVNGILGNKDNVIGRWRLFLQARFAQSEWTVVLIQNRSNAFTQLGRFSGIYAAVVLLILMIVSLFSIYLIRKNMVPLEALMTGIRSMSDNRFDTQLSIKSDDEFEEVADAFNTMTSQIGNQISRLQTQAEIDQLILSRPSIDDIVNIALAGIERLIECTWVGMAILSDEKSHTFQLKGRPSGEDHATIIKSFTLSRKELQTAITRSSILVTDSDEEFTLHLSSILMHNRLFMILPIINVDGLFALLILGYDSEPPTQDLEQATEFSNRIAVAFSNAAWEEKLYQQAHFDALTGLPNRMLLEDRLEQEISHALRANEYVAILFLDLDRFKNVNDSLGHEFGDMLLKIIAKRLAKCLRQEDTVARLGGDEFIVLVRGLASSNKALATTSSIAEKIISEITRPLLLEEHDIRMTTSIGIAICPTDGKDKETLLSNADSAMYHAKDLGRGNFQFYSEQLNKAARFRLEMESKLHKALDDDEFEFHYQPKVDPKTNIITGGEALIRWNDKQEGLISPAQFIPIAEEVGLATRIGMWGLKKACHQAQVWNQLRAQPLRISVNITAQHFHHGNLLEHVKTSLQESGLQPSCLEIEITESTAMYDMEHTITILNEIREMGVVISIDDFGTGYSSLTYLKYFPVYALKIDRSFIKQIPYSEKDFAIVRSTIVLAHNLGIKVIAEGVENHEQLQALNAMGCNEIQGYLFSRPLPVDQFSELLARVTLSPPDSATLQESGTSAN